MCGLRKSILKEGAVETRAFKVPEGWGLSDQEEFVIGTLMDTPGRFHPAYELCNTLYRDYEGGARFKRGYDAPTKLRVLVLRCRRHVAKLSKGRAKIEGKRGRGWRITRKSHKVLCVRLV